MNPEGACTWVRAAVVVAALLRLPALDSAIRRPPSDTRLEEVDAAGVRALVARPASTGAFPCIVFANAVHQDGSSEPYARRLIDALARVGFVVLAPDLPGLRRGEITASTLGATIELAREAADRPDVDGGRVALVGASTGGALAILAAADPLVAHRVSIVGAVAPFADLENVLRLATTGFYAKDDRLLPYQVAPRLASAAARSLALTLPAGSDRAALLAALRSAAQPPAGVAPLERPIDGLAPDATAVAELLRNRDPRRFDELFRALPPTSRALIAALSPVRAVERLRVPVEIAVAPSDRYFPPVECEALAERGPTVRLTVTATLDHARPALRARDVRDAARFVGFAARVLDSAARPAGTPSRGAVGLTNPGVGSAHPGPLGGEIRATAA